MGIISDFPWGMEASSFAFRFLVYESRRLGAERRREGECALLAGGRRRKIAETSEGPRYDDVTSWGRYECARLGAERRHAKLCLTERCVVTRLEVMRIPFRLAIFVALDRLQPLLYFNHVIRISRSVHKFAGFLKTWLKRICPRIELFPSPMLL